MNGKHWSQHMAPLQGGDPSSIKNLSEAANEDSKVHLRSRISTSLSRISDTNLLQIIISRQNGQNFTEFTMDKLIATTQINSAYIQENWDSWILN
ncbi:hypothetical protein Trydic_g20845 [Trypoxylus dichotomus]